MAEALAPGSPDDRATLSLGNETVLICENYEVTSAVLTQPNAFSLTLGHGDVTKGLIDKYPSNTPFTLFIGGQKQFTGTTDGFVADEGSGATEFTLQGRDFCKSLMQSEVDTEITLKNVTYSDLVKAILSQPDVGLASSAEFLQTSNSANRKIRTGVHVLVRIEPKTLDQIIASPDVGGTSVEYVTAKVGQTWWDVLNQKLKVAGLFLWNDNAGNFVLSQPAAQQNPVYRIERWRGKNPNQVNAEHSRYQNLTTHRHSEIVCYSRIGRTKYARSTVSGRFTDPEMQALGYTNKRVVHDKWITSPAEAEFMARRILAEERRAGWILSYEVAGHTTRAISGEVATWAPDTVVEVRDDEFGLDGQYYLESCEYRGTGGDNGSTTTTLHLMRMSDLIFGEDE